MARGRGHKKIEQEGIELKVNSRGELNIGKRIMEDLGFWLNQKVVVKKIEGKNVMGAMLVIEPASTPEDDKLL